MKPADAVVQVTGVTQWDAWQAKTMPPVERLRPWLWSIPVPIPRSPLRYVNCYVFAVDGGVVLVDTGWPDQETLDALRAGLRECGYALADVLGILTTHTHPDHYGLAARVVEESGAWIAMHSEEAAQLPPAGTYRDAGTTRQRRLDMLLRMGVPERDAEVSVGPLTQWTSRFTELPQPDVRFQDGDVILAEHDVRAVWTPGHTRGHTCYYLGGERLLISGDHLLPRITPNITAFEVGGVVPLRQFLDSLRRVRDLDVSEVLPAHEYRFTHHRERANELLEHHDRRLEEITSAVEENPGSSAWQLAEHLSWSRPWAELPPAQWTFALGETLSHLAYLWATGTVVPVDEEQMHWETPRAR